MPSCVPRSASRTAGRGAACTRRRSRRRRSGPSGIGPLEWYFNDGPWPSPGAAGAVNNTYYQFSRGYPDPDDPDSGRSASTTLFTVTNLPSYRLAIDMTDLDGARIVITTGQSGNPFDRALQRPDRPVADGRDPAAAVHPGRDREATVATLTLSREPRSALVVARVVEIERSHEPGVDERALTEPTVAPSWYSNGSGSDGLSQMDCITSDHDRVREGIERGIDRARQVGDSAVQPRRIARLDVPCEPAVEQPLVRAGTGAMDAHPALVGRQDVDREGPRRA